MMRSRLIEAWFRLRASFRRRRLERDLDDEIAFHIAMRQDAVAAARASTPDANREAHRQFGSVTGVKERMREMWTFPSVESIWQDAVYATRRLRRQPGFTAVVLLVLGAAIGLNTSLFTVSAGLLLRPWPGITDPSRVVALYLPQSTGPAAGRMGFSIADYRFLAAHTAALQSVAVMSPDSEVRLGAEGAAGLALMVSANFFDVLGLAMARGRGFHADEDRPGNPLPVAVLAHPFWQSRLGGDPDIVGKRLRVNDVEFTVVGVASREWASSEPSFGVNVFLPVAAISLTHRREEAARFLYSPTFCCSDVVGRLAPGFGRQQARAELRVMSGQFESSDGTQARGVAATGTEFAAHPGREPIRWGLLLVSSGLLLVWMIACANIGNLLLARAAARVQEIGIRLSLGASRSRVVRQLITEGLVLALIASAIGVGLAYELPNLVFRLVASGQAESFPFDVSPDWVVVGYAVLAAGLSSLAFGLAPALHATRANVVSALNSREALPTSRFSLRNVLLAAQVAASVVLLVSAGLLVRGIQQQSRSFKPGFTVDDVTVVSFETPPGRYDEAQSRTLVAGISDALANLPAVRFGFASLEPFSLFRNATVVHLPGRSTDDPQMMSYLGVTPGYFGVLGIPIVAGRNFTAADTGTSVVLINEQMASSYWPNTNALGQTFVTGRSQSHEIVGIVRNVRTNTLEDIQPLFYQPLSGGGAVPKLLLHANGPAGFDLIASTVSRIDSRVRVQRTTLSTILATRLESSRWGPLLAGILGAFALALASVGMFGVFAYAVRQRTREIGIRMALGAQPRAVVRLVLAGHSRVVVVGLLLGLLGGVAASFVLRHSLHGLSPFDPIAYLGVAALLAGAALMASYVPARRATRIDPIEALRCD